MWNNFTSADYSSKLYSVVQMNVEPIVPQAIAFHFDFQVIHPTQQITDMNQWNALHLGPRTVNRM